jgi:hypothetical protein
MELQLDATITVELILEINKTVIVASSWSSIFILPKKNYSLLDTSGKCSSLANNVPKKMVSVHHLTKAFARYQVHALHTVQGKAFLSSMYIMPG